MSTSKSLQTPSIIGILGSTIRIKHPDISRYTRTFLRAPIAAAATAMSVFDNNNFADDDFFIIGEIGDGKTEEDDVNGAVTRGSALTVTNTLKFDHEINDPVTRIYERKLTIYGSSTDGGTLTAIRGTGTAISIQWDKPYTEFTILTTDTAYSFYVVKFYDGATESSASDYVASSGLAYTTAQAFIDSALRLTNSDIDNLITWEFLIGCVQDCQDEIAQFAYQDRLNGNIMKKDWSFEVIENDTSTSILTFENRYALSGLTYALKYTDTKQAILNVRFGRELLKFFPIQEYDDAMESMVRSELSTAYTAGATSMVLKDSSLFTSPSSGTASGQIGNETFTYTTNTVSTGTLSGIPASGTGSLATSYAVDRAVWQGASSGKPTRYTIFDGNIYLDVPPSNTYVNYKLKFRYLRAMNRITEPSDTTIVTFTNAFQWYIASRIEYRRQRFDKAKEHMARFQELVLMNAKGEKSPVLDAYQYYTWSDGEEINDSPTGFNSGEFDT